MNSIKTNSQWSSALLIILILATRIQHFGSALYLPDATLAALFMGGLMVNARAWLALAIAAAFAMDAYAIGWKGVSDYCMSIGYWGLIPTYAMVWGFGRWLNKYYQPVKLAPYALSGFVAFSLAFVLSNAFWYAFSDKVAGLTIAEFAQRVGVYYLPYVGYSMMYSAIGWGLLSLSRTGIRLGKAS